MYEIKPRLLTEKELKLTSEYFLKSHNDTLKYPLIVDDMQLEFLSVEGSEEVFFGNKYATIHDLANLVMSNKYSISKGTDMVCKLGYIENDKFVYVKLGVKEFIYMMIDAYIYYKTYISNSTSYQHMKYTNYDDIGLITHRQGFLKHEKTAFNNLHHYNDESTVDVTRSNVLHTLDNSDITYQYYGLSNIPMRNILFANNSTIKIIMNQRVTVLSSELCPEVIVNDYKNIIIGNNNTITIDINYRDDVIGDSVFLHGDNNILNYHGYDKYLSIDDKPNITRSNMINVSGTSNTMNIYGAINRLCVQHTKLSTINIYGTDSAYQIDPGRDTVITHMGKVILSASRRNEDDIVEMGNPEHDTEIELLGFISPNECDIHELAWYYGELLYTVEIHNIRGYTSARHFRKYNDFVITKMYENTIFQTYYIAHYDDEYAHGYTKKDAVQDLRCRLGLGDVTEDALNLMHDIIESDHITKDDYRELTGACKAGMDMFCNDHDIDGDEMKFSDLMKILTEKNEGYHRIHHILNKINNTK